MCRITIKWVFCRFRFDSILSVTNCHPMDKFQWLRFFFSWAYLILLNQRCILFFSSFSWQTHFIVRFLVIKWNHWRDREVKCIVLNRLQRMRPFTLVECNQSEWLMTMKPSKLNCMKPKYNDKKNHTQREKKKEANIIWWRGWEEKTDTNLYAARLIEYSVAFNRMVCYMKRRKNS